MENAEEVMQSLEEFTKMRPKEIPKELEDYLGYVAKTGDPVYQWSLVKNLFREKLIKVITDFFESTLTVELPACPNVEPFSYDRMKNSLLERFDTFNSAPFTVQRICELLTNPRKEYNRADKYMRAIEKNILVVSTREPGTGKRPLESDSQQETILNGMPDVKVNESDGSLMHVPTDLPYLGAPPASNDVTVETSEPIMVDPVNDRVGFGIDIIEESKTEATDSIKTWVSQEPLDSVVESEQACSTSELLDVEETLIKEKCLEIRDCDADSRFVDLENCPSNSNRPISDIPVVSESSSNVLVLKNEMDLVVSETPSIDSSESSIDINKVHDNADESVGLNVNDENEVSSTPTDIVKGTLDLDEEIDLPLDSEAEATGSSIEQSPQSVEKLTDLTESEINSSEGIIKSNDTLSIVTVTEVSGSNTSDETAVECSENEITGTVDSPTSPTSDLSPQSEDIGILAKDGPVIVEECEQPDIHPDSSNDVSSATLKEITTSPVEDSPEPDTVEADSISESYEAQNSKSEPVDVKLDQNNSKSIKCTSPSVQASSPSLDINIGNVPVVEESSVKVLEENILSTSSIEHIVPNEGVSIGTVQEEDPKLAKTLSANQVAEVGLMYEQEQREESVIQSLPNVPSSIKEISTVEDISVDAGCEAEEEAMDVDDSSNQMMMISEGENEGEPMDQSDQLQS